MVSTFSSASHDTDARMRTDFKIVTTYANGTTHMAQIWMKNIGTNRVGTSEIQRSDVIIGLTGNMGRAQFSSDGGYITLPPPAIPPTILSLTDNQWTYNLFDDNNNNLWDTGETLEIRAAKSQFSSAGQPVYFQFVLPNGVSRSLEFTLS